MQFRRKDIEYVEGDEISPSNLRKADVERYAERVGSLADFEVGQHPADLVELLGGRIHYQDVDDWIDEAGSIFVHGESDFDILLPEYTSPRRDRFTAAHELGHYFLHSGQGDNAIIAYRRGSTRIEWEANWFAAALLMPEEPFRQACQELANLTAIAARFGVSEDAAEVRRKVLGA